MVQAILAHDVGKRLGGGSAFLHILRLFLCETEVFEIAWKISRIR